MLFDKYSKQKAITSDRSLKKGWGHLHTKEGHLHLQGLLQDSRVNHHSKANALLHHGHHQVQMHHTPYMMTMEWCGCHTNKPFILDGVDKNQLFTESPGLSKTDWLLAILVRVTRPDRSDRCGQKSCVTSSEASLQAEAKGGGVEDGSWSREDYRPRYYLDRINGCSY
jgi:hypothetical protein